MTRHVLENLNGRRFRCRAIIERFGTKNAFRGPPLTTLLLRDVTDPMTGAVLTEHLWFTAGNWSEGLQPGDAIEFEARVTEYLKGYRGRRDDVWGAPVRVDYRLERPTQVRKIAEPDLSAGALFEVPA
ncbi:hypothetical protein [Roseicella sp. DB1501]|uniref:hypothetical protein n=1 Tax=Roseicella sp. DB1501 TaxID=2730925 RepID=UPI001492A611|nr:hypothetical protein [Roseicella sp. DB1501]NOG73744.1 hypothetical protein [Roseicella sp. DB1501]